MITGLLDRLGGVHAVDAVCDPELLPFYSACGLSAGTAATLRRG